MLRGPLAITSVVAYLFLTACGGDPTDDAAADVVTLPSTTTIVAPVASDRCEDEPDPADYPVGEAPTAVPPCDEPTELTHQTIRDGDGRGAEVGDGVVYHATVIRSDDGELVSSSWADGRPHYLRAVGSGEEIRGLDDSLIGARPDEVLRVDMPADLAFGDNPPPELGVIRAGDALTFVVEVVSVIPRLVADDAPRGVDVQPSVGAAEVTFDDVVVGDGKAVEAGDTVVIAMLLARGDNLVILVDSWHQGEPQVFTVDPVLTEGVEPATLAGIVEGIQGARVGGRRVITMPPSAAWGDEGRPALGLPPNTDVIAVIDVLASY